MQIPLLNQEIKLALLRNQPLEIKRMSAEQVDIHVANYYLHSERFFTEQMRFDLYANYMDIVDKTIRIGWVHGKSDDDIFRNINDITTRKIEPCLAGFDPIVIGATHAI